VVSTISSQPPMIADDLRRQPDDFTDLVELRSRIVAISSERSPHAIRLSVCSAPMVRNWKEMKLRRSSIERCAMAVLFAPVKALRWRVPLVGTQQTGLLP
jgi:hypothetical protein